ncbi:AIPR family protein [Kitasatospora nipponensis]|uniref:AIPR family protein n=1 Tax=Kitasatospora nipponensis TaxID=258049 RepID=A0ABP4GLC0_9ACTN
MAELDQTAFARDLVADVLATAEAEHSTTPETFTRRVLEDLEQAGIVSNTFTAYHKSHGVEVHGYGWNESTDSLDLFVTDFRLSPLEEKLTKALSESLFRRLLTFVRRCEKGLRQHIDESSDVYDMCSTVEKAIAEVEHIRLFLFTNCVSTSPAPEPTELDGIPVTYETWDLRRIHRHASSGTLSEPIVVTFAPPLTCLAAPSTEPDYSVVLAVTPGQLLAELYGEHGPRLLELNVRSFLQARGSVNRGIRATLLDAPGRFLAYNNGITATASQVDFVHDGDGRPIGISRVHGLQIVNGGQTTASLHHAWKRDKADLSQVRVQMKLSVVDPERLAEIVPKISEYSNTQNKVTLVDFSSNHEYHVAIQRITRTLWAPALDGSGQETHWFYERARGQYADDLAKRSPAQQRQFRLLWPTRQKFTKSDLAKFVHSWEQLPHLVSRGAQKNFGEFMIRLQSNLPHVDARYCQRLVAKAILFKAVDRVAATHGAGSHKSLVTTYTVARLSQAVDRRIDLDRIWREQQVSAVLESALHELCPKVMTAVTTPLRGNHVGEWAKQIGCWDAVSRVRWVVPAALAAELADLPLQDVAVANDGGAPTADVAEVLEISPEEWTAIERWAKETRSLEPWQRQLASTIGRRLAAGEEIGEAQAAQAIHVRNEAMRVGFSPAYDV